VYSVFRSTTVSCTFSHVAFGATNINFVNVIFVFLMQKFQKKGGLDNLIFMAFIMLVV
jgi:hypothetical protein